MPTATTGDRPTAPEPQHPPRTPQDIGYTGSPLGKLTATGVPPWIALLEILLIPLVALAIGFLLNPQDPLWIHSDFHWTWLAPVIVALRYGPLAGLSAAGVLLASWLAWNRENLDQFPQVFFLGGLIIVMLVGEFSSLWRARTRRAETVQHYLNQRMEHLIRQYYMLRLSHDRLEQELIGRPMSMRDALKTLRGLGSVQTDSQTLLRLLAQYCQISAAALYRTDNQQLVAEPLASIGSPIALHGDDPLVRQALESGKLCHVAQVTAAQQTSRYLVAAPLLDLGGDIYGLLLVDEMPFFSVQDENLQTINLLLGYFTDGLSTQALAQPLQQEFPACPSEFAFELQRLWRMHQKAGVPSVIVALEFTAAAVERDMPQQLLRLRRLMDETWLIQGPGRQVLAMLMPLGDASTAEGFLARLERWMDQKEGISLADAGVFPHQLPLGNAPPLATLQRLHGIAHA
ncbi:MAG TPA: PelD GGDEF domain-containing protein [Acidovorax sp.]|nr:PelD GGDEF domain-containing protein [Acidovorax sp.]